MKSRPQSFQIVRAFEDERGNLYLWINASGTILAFGISPAWLQDVKIRQGWALIVIDEFNNILGVSNQVEDADDRAVDWIVARTFDRWEKHSVEWDVDNAWQGAPTPEQRRDLTHRPDLLGPVRTVAKEAKPHGPLKAIRREVISDDPVQ